MGNVIQFKGPKVEQDADETELAPFKGQIEFEEMPFQLDFINFMVGTVMQLPELSKREFMKGMRQFQDLTDRAIQLNDPELTRILIDLGFAAVDFAKEKK